MFTRLLIVAMCVFSSTAIADEIQTNFPPATSEQILNLPQDANKLYLTVYGHPDDERYQQVRKWFDTNPELRVIRAQVHYAAIDTNSTLFKERYAHEVRTTPCVRVVTPDGVEIFTLDVNRIPMNDSDLTHGIRTELLNRVKGLRERLRPQQPQPQQETPNERLKRRVDERIDDRIDNANLPPITRRVLAPVIRVAIKVAFVVVVVAGLALAVSSTLRDIRARQ